MSTTPSPLSVPLAGQACSCGSGRHFEACCQPILNGEALAESAEALMRARFTAHVAGNHSFLHKSYQGTAAQPYIPPREEGVSPWTRLVIESHELVKPEVATVEFTAFFVEKGVEVPHQEKAEFHQLNGAWIYTKALRLGPAPLRKGAKVGRNEPCPCGSGKKYKQCCGK